VISLLDVRTRPTTVHPQTRDRAWSAHRSVASAAALVVLLVTAGFAWHGHVAAVDRSLTSALVQSPGSTGADAGRLLSFVGSGGLVAAFALVVAFVVWRRPRDLVLAAVVPLAGAIAGVAELLGKHVVGRLRPVTAAASGELGYGFPSGHTTGFTAMAVAVSAVAAFVLARPRRRLLDAVLASLALVVGMARVLVGVHYVSDIVAGLALGVLCANVAVGMACVVRRRSTPV
jgi:membrane-associated phospholipid phosphatase